VPPPPTAPARSARWLLAAGLLAATVAALEAAAIPPVVYESHVALQIDTLVVQGGTSRQVGATQQAESSPDAPAKIRAKIPWGPDGGEATVTLEASLVELSTDGGAVIRCAASVTPPGGATVRARRDMTLGDEGSSFFEVYGDSVRRILLAVKGERVERAVVRTAIMVGDPVRFLVGIEKLDGDRAVPLESNELHTFVGQSVEYSFHRGQDASLESVRLTILPVAITDDLVTLQIEVNGALPGPDGPSLIAHHERIVASRRAVSTVTAAPGAPPSGYRFQVTPDF